VKKIFICYRRAETEYAAGALGRDLRIHFGEEQVFRDKEDIGAGVSWREKIRHEIGHDSALLVLIAKGWAEARDGKGERRLEQTDDSVRAEVCDGLRDGATVIPVLLENAEMPDEQGLPAELRPIAEHNARRLRDSDWAYDLSRICSDLEQAGFRPVARSAAAKPAAAGPPAISSAAPAESKRPRSVKTIISYVLAGIALASYSGAHDPAAHAGLAVLGGVALVLAVLAFRDYRQGKAGGKRSTIGAMVLAALTVLGNIGGAVGNAPSGDHRASPEKPAAQPPPPGAESGASDIAGAWKDATDGTQVVFEQSGLHVASAFATQEGMVRGEGTIAGREVQMTLSAGQHPIGMIYLTLSPDGRALEGNLVIKKKTSRIRLVR
jgi:hypothetical protein